MTIATEHLKTSLESWFRENYPDDSRGFHVLMPDEWAEHGEQRIFGVVLYMVCKREISPVSMIGALQVYAESFGYAVDGYTTKSKAGYPVYGFQPSPIDYQLDLRPPQGTQT